MLRDDGIGFTACHGIPNPLQQRCAAGDEGFESLWGAGEEVFDQKGVLVVDDDQARLIRTRGDHMCEAHPSTLPGQRVADTDDDAVIGWAHDQ